MCRDCKRQRPTRNASCFDCLGVRNEMVKALMAGGNKTALVREMRKQFRKIGQGSDKP